MEAAGAALKRQQEEAERERIRRAEEAERLRLQRVRHACVTSRRVTGWPDVICDV